jgi:acyl-CoA thioesterase
VAERGAPAAEGEARAGEVAAFDRDTAVLRLPAERRLGEHRQEASFLAEIAPAWCINGRPHGGYLAAILMRALIATVDDRDRSPRSLTIHFLRPSAPGAARIHVTTERAGGSLSTLSARIEQGDEAVALALAAFSRARASLEVMELPLPDVAAQDPARETSAELAERIDQGLAPSFLRKLVMQVRGVPPFSGSEGPLQANAWLGLADPGRPLDAIALALFSDALFPTPFMRLREPAGAPTIDLTIHFRTPLSPLTRPDRGELCLARFDSRVIHQGFFEEDGVIWAADGTVLAQSRQLALLIAPAGR